METSCFRQKIETLSELIEQQRKLVPICTTDGVTADRTYAALDKLGTVVKQEIQILVAGKFSSGKTTLLNALLGEELLFTSVLPSTAIPVELHYGTEKRAVIYPRKGSWRGGDRPFEVSPSAEELRKYCGWNQDDNGNLAESLLKKAEIFIPNRVLEQSTFFIEVPATVFDSNCHQCKFLEYVSHTDIVLYVINATSAFSYYDCSCLKWLRGLLGPDLPILFAVTFFDMVLSEEETEFTDYVRRYALPYTAKSGMDAVHFVDSWGALKAQKANDHTLLEQSGLNRLEAFIYELCHKKNCNKINGIIQQMEQVNMDLSTQIETLYNVDAPNHIRTSNEFRERSKELLGAQLQIELIRQELNDLRHHCE